MIPTSHDYYRRRAREHRKLALNASNGELRQMHENLVTAYSRLASDSRLRQRVSLRPGIALAADSSRIG